MDAAEEDIGAVRKTTCSASGAGPALGAIYISFVGPVCPSASGFLRYESNPTVLAVGGELCSTEFDLTGFAVSPGLRLR